MSRWIGRGARLLVVSLASSAGIACGSSDNPDLFGERPDAGEPDAGSGGAGGEGGDGGEMGEAGAAGEGGNSSEDAGMGGQGGSPSEDAGMGGEGGNPPVECVLSIDAPLSNSTLTIADDLDSDCSNGIQVDVEALTNADSVELQIDNGTPQSEAVVDGAASFAAVTIGSEGVTSLSVNVPDEAGCEETISVTGNCPVPPTCEITLPAFTAEKTSLNGVPVPNGDRVGDEGQPYRTRVEVATNAADGELVLLSGSDSTLAATVSNGLAVFPSVPLTPDGPFTLDAECRDGLATTNAASLSVTVDSTPPVIDTANVSPVDGQHYSPNQDMDTATPELDFDVCVPVESADALDLPASKQDNLCVSIGTQAAECAPATTSGISGGTDGGCVRIQCPGSAAFDLNVVLKDEAGNPTTHVINGVTCASEKPSVQVIRPLDATNAPDNISLRLLANSMPDPQLKDKDPALAGAQTDVVACTNAENGSARLLVGLAGATLTEVASLATLEVPAQGECPADLTSVARFVNVTLPQSTTTTGGALQTNTEIQVEVTDQSTETNLSGPVRLWVDSQAPTVGLISPSASQFCGSVISSGTDVERQLQFNSTAFPAPVTVSVENGGDTGPSYVADDVLDVLAVTFPVGDNILLGTTTEPSGNTGALPDCTVTVGEPPAIVWVNPPPDTTALNAQQTLPAAGTVQDADSAVEGWQGLLQVTVSNLDPGEEDTGSVQFRVNGTDFGPALPLSAGTGDATTRTVSLDTATVQGGLPEGADVTLRAQLLGTVPENAASISNLVIDTIAPSGPTQVVPAVGPNPGDRRRTRFLVTWTAAADGQDNAEPVAGYKIAYSHELIDSQETFDLAFDNVDPLDRPGGMLLASPPVGPGEVEQQLVGDLRLEQAYFFSVQAFDAAGNLGPVVQGDSGDLSVGPAVKARFNSQILTPPDDSGTEFGLSMDGSTDLTGDGLSDLVVGSFDGNKVYIFKGTPSGFSSTPTVTIQGPTAGKFGFSVAVVGDINNDTPGTSPTPQQVAQSQDLVITAGQETSSAGGTGRAYVFFGRNWEDPANANLTVADDDHDVIIESSVATFFEFVSHVGDFNNDGADDFALTMPPYNGASVGTFEGGVAVILGSTVADSFPAITVPTSGDSRMIIIEANRTDDFYLWSFTTSGSQPVIGLGDLFGAGSGIAVAHPQTDELFAFNDTSGASGVMLHTEAVDTHSGPGNTFTGNFGWGLSSGFVLSVANPNHQPGAPSREGSVDVFLSTAADPFPAPLVRLHDNTAFDNFGQVLVGNTFSGRSGAYGTRMLGDTSQTSSDLLVSSATLGGTNITVPTIRIISGARLQGMSGLVNVSGSAANHDVVFNLLDVPGVRAPLPEGSGNWLGTLGAGIRDLNGDGYMDFALSEFQPGSDHDGEIIILY